MVTFEEIMQITDKLSSEDKFRLMKYLDASLKKDRAETEPLDSMGYPIGYFDETYGSMADDPLERNQPSQPDVREELE